MTESLDARSALDAAMRTSHARLMAGLVRRARGDYVRAEDALGDACAEALVQWERDGVPGDPAAWLATAAARRFIDGARRIEVRREVSGDTDLGPSEAAEDHGEMRDARLDFGSDDDTLRLIFTSCHPSLAPLTRVALTLNAVSGFDAMSIARAFLVDEPAMAKRLSRAKVKIRDAGIAFSVPSAREIPERLPDVLKAIELVFNEGYSRARGDAFDAPDLAQEALQLAGELARLLPHEPETLGLLAMVQFTHARRAARVSAAGDLVRLADQDRTLWDWTLIEEGRSTLRSAVLADGSGPYVLRAALTGEHSRAQHASDTRWSQIVGLYDALLEWEASPVIALNRAVAVGESDGPAPMLSALEAIDGLDGSHYYHVARGDALERLGLTADAQAAFRAGLSLARNAKEAGVIRSRLVE